LGKAKALKTAPATFIIPTEIATNRDHVSKYAEQLEFCVRNNYASKEFVQRCIDEGLPITEHLLHTELYDELVKLDKANKNGVWARIIKNAFAPLFIGHVDYVAGNPPWVNWRNLPADYRAGMIPVWENYGLFTQKGLKARLGAGMDDISVLMTYVSGNEYLREGGRLGFVLTQTLFQSAGGGQGFRRFSLPGNKFFNIQRVHDFSSFQPFEGASNRTATITSTVSKSPTKYPVQYFKMDLRISKEALESSFHDPEPFTVTNLEATPVSADKTSAWSVLPKGMAKVVDKLRGVSNYSARIGAHSGGAAGVFWVDVKEHQKKLALISNRWDAGRNKYDPITASVEAKLVRPLLRGRDVHRWKTESSLSILIPYEVNNDGRAITESQMKKDFPRTLEYFNNFRAKMLKRPHYIQHFKPSDAPFWSMYNVGNYSFAQWRVVWREQTSSFQCAVVESDSESTTVADAKLIVVACSSSDEAHYLAAVLNSSPARFLIDSYVVNVQISTHVLKNISVPMFSPKSTLHAALAKQSRVCHLAAIANDASTLAKAEEEIDNLACKLWGLDATSLERIRSHMPAKAADIDADSVD
jgi:hypothetical protein